MPKTIKQNNFTKDLTELWDRRQDRVYEKIYELSIERDFQDLYKQIKELLPNTSQSLLKNLIDLKSECEINRNQLLYKQGFCDGINLVITCVHNTVITQ